MEERLEDFLSLLKELQKIHPEFPLQYAICLTEIARNEGLSLTQLAERTGMPLSTVSRIVAALSEDKKRSYRLLHVTISPEERRRKKISLSARGKTLVEGLIEILSSAIESDEVKRSETGRLSA